jgi:hypothetical protein
LGSSVPEDVPLDKISQNWRHSAINSKKEKEDEERNDYICDDCSIIFAYVLA